MWLQEVVRDGANPIAWSLWVKLGTKSEEKWVNFKGNHPEYSLEGLILKLKLQNFGHLMQRSDSLEKTLMLGGIGGRRRRGWQSMRWLDGITDSLGLSWWWTRKPGVLQSMGSQRVWHNWATKPNWIKCLKRETYDFEISLWLRFRKLIGRDRRMATSHR